ncbi:hypothetical protein BKA70DRAFT_1422668 [Coprinopsis sp. MPI-PUGE-AT-0042]|nr:hypothetical protein BKA70DRAFT_1422668 [Coprinopsis sp. MPI-PUGE-AT-0042]
MPVERPASLQIMEATKSRLHWTWKQREQSRSDDPLYECGKQVARTVHAFLSFKNWKTLDLGHRRQHEIYLEVVRLISLAGDDLEQSSPAIRDNIVNMTAKGMAAAHANDIRVLRVQLPTWLYDARDSVVSDANRHRRDTIDGLLCPVTLDWSEESIKASLRSSPQPLDLDRRPGVLYRHGAYDVSDHWDGFLQNVLLVKAFRCIARTVPKHCPSLEPERRVSISAICYIATLLLTVLSESGLQKYERGALRRFYRVLDEHLRLLEHGRRVQELLEWWDRQIFGSSGSLSTIAG